MLVTRIVQGVLLMGTLGTVGYALRVALGDWREARLTQTQQQLRRERRRAYSREWVGRFDGE